MSSVTKHAANVRCACFDDAGLVWFTWSGRAAYAEFRRALHYLAWNAMLGRLQNPCRQQPVSHALLVPIQTFILTNSSSTNTDCTDLATIPLADYSFLTVQTKCTGPGTGYLLNGPANVAGSTPSPANTLWACNLFRTSANLVCTGYMLASMCVQYLCHASQVHQPSASLHANERCSIW